MKRALILIAGLFLSTPAWAGTISANATLTRGTIIQASDVSVQHAANESREQLLAEVVGQEVKRTIYSGQRINQHSIGTPVLVKRNSRVTMIYRYGRLEITAFGRALEAGGVGDIVTIMNLDSRQKVISVINKSGSVEVTL